MVTVFFRLHVVEAGEDQFQGFVGVRLRLQNPRLVSMFYAFRLKQTWTIQMWPGTIPFTVSRTPNPGARWLY